MARERFLRRRGMSPPSDLTERRLRVGTVDRTYWLAARPAPGSGPPPVLVALHGAGGQGPGMASLTGLDRRGPAAGFVTVFPDGVGRVWSDAREAPRLRRRQGVDDIAFLSAVLDDLRVLFGPIGGLHLTGISNGSLLAEQIARHHLLDVAGVGLVAGAGTVPARSAMPRPAQATTVLIFAGTADPLVPYGGGPIGPLGRMVNRRAGGDAGRGLAVAAEAVAGDWVAADGITTAPVVDTLAGDVPVTRTTWSEPGRPSVVLHRIEGGGHTWPGGPQYLPERFVGRTTHAIDATATLLAWFGGRP